MASITPAYNTIHVHTADKVKNKNMYTSDACYNI